MGNIATETESMEQPGQLACTRNVLCRKKTTAATGNANLPIGGMN
jgi:hypothetical protein